MITVEEALQLIDNQSVKRKPISLPVIDSLGYHLAVDMHAPFDLPNFDNSAMDGYAICGDGTEYQIIGEIKAGDTAKHELSKGQAFRIFTGAMVPGNATAVIMQEKTEVTGDVLHVEDTIVPGKNIRPKGEQLREGALVFNEGVEITPPVIGLLQSMGMTEVNVFRKPIIHLLSTGDELVNPGDPLKPGQIYESNTQTLVSAAKQHGFEITKVVRIKDTYEDTRLAVEEALNQCDVLLLSGGISVGDYDFVGKALAENDVEQVFYKVKQKPGKPLYAGRKHDTMTFALPGNPASALTCFYIYTLPYLKKFSGNNNGHLKRISLPLTHSWELKSDRSLFLKAHVNLADGVTILEGQGSSMLYAFTQGNALVYLNGLPRTIYTGDMVEVILVN